MTNLPPVSHILVTLCGTGYLASRTIWSLSGAARWVAGAVGCVWIEASSRPRRASGCPAGGWQTCPCGSGKKYKNCCGRRR
ncbi:MAG: SEC-C domain-containing protein [Planctomycetes bacterium]|nr:SEC-C domain-containing protein [Planctomycetota bacterium]